MPRPAVTLPLPIPNNLPTQLTSFVGREAEMADVTELLRRSRLLTLTGPGGAGKTRLAWQVAAEAAGGYPDGVWWVELAGIADQASVPEAAATVIGALVELTDPLRSMTAHLARRRVLICLDNAEHLLEAVASVAEALLRGCPHVTVLITSREPLSLPGEVVWRVPPLEDTDALALFAERAAHVRANFTLDASNETAVRSIARHLDGIPLALELAAAWLATLSPRQIEAALDDRFRLLVRGPRGAQRRQLTLAGSIDWSHALLDEPDRIVFRRLAVFVGDFGLGAAAGVAAGEPVPDTEVLPALGRLVDKSLVMAEERDGETRYRLLETLRAYALARLVEAGEESALRNRHLAWYVEFAEWMDPAREQEPDVWRRVLRADYQNLRAALDWGLAAEDPHTGRRLAASLGWLWHLDRRGREGLQFLRWAVERAPDDRSALQARVLTALALVADTAGPLDLEYDAATRALELATEVGDESLRALCLTLAAVGSFYTDFDDAWMLCEKAYRSALLAQNRFVLGGARALQSIILHLRDRHAEAEALVDETVRSNLELHHGVLATVLGSHAIGALATGDASRALGFAEDAVHLAEPLGDYLRVGAARSTLAYIKAMTGDLDGAEASVEPILRLVEGAEDGAFVPGLGHTMGVLAMRRDQPQNAARWLAGEAGSTDRGIETYLAANALSGLGGALALAGRIDEAVPVLERAVTVARRLGMPRPLAEALEAQAEIAAVARGDLERAIDLDHAALTLRLDNKLQAFVPDSLDALARHAAAIKPRPDDVRAMAASESARRSMHLPRAPHMQVLFAAAVAKLHAALGETVFDQAWDEGARLSLEEAAGYARRARGARGRPPTGWASLTPTELDVVRLVADGLSNPEIGRRLFMSRGTVKTHLAHVFAKLGVMNRTELAALAIRQLGRGES